MELLKYTHVSPENPMNISGRLQHKALVYLFLLLIFFPTLGESQPTLPIAEDTSHIPVIHAGGDVAYPPFEFINTDGEPDGYNVDIMKAVAAVQGLNVEIKLGPWNEVRTALEKGELDMLIGMSYSSERAKKVDFTEPHFIHHHAIFIRKNTRGIQSVQDLKDKYIIVQKGDIMDDWVKENNISSFVIEQTNQPDALRLLASGQYDAVLANKLQGLYYINRYKLTNLESVGDPIYQTEYGFAVKKGNLHLKEQLNEGLAIIKSTGRARQIYQKWFGLLVTPEKAIRDFIQSALIIFLILLCILLAFSIWNRSLRNKVSERTRELLDELTERKKAEEALRESEERYRTLIESANDAIMILQAESRSLLVLNRKAVKLLGGDDSPLEGRPLKDFFPEEYKEQYDQIFQELIQSKASFGNSEEMLILNNQGEQIEVEVNANIIELKGAKVIWVILRDIRERKSLQAQIMQSQKMEIVGTLAGGIAHDFNNILTTIMGNSELIKVQSNVSDTTKEYADEIYQSGKRGAELIRQLLLFARKTAPQFQLCDFHFILDDTLRLIKRNLQGNSECPLDITYQLEAESYHLSGDPIQLEQVIMNLALNARDAMPQGGQLTFQTQNRQVSPIRAMAHQVKPGNYLVFSVKDTGVGMDEHTKKNIFNPFFTTKPVGKGTGLGMAVVYGVTTSHKGFIQIESEPGKGTRINIYFPLPEKNGKENPESSSEKHAYYGNETILLADSHPEELKAGKDILEQYGYTVLTATQEDEILNLAEEYRNRLALVILELLLPETQTNNLKKELLIRYPNIRVLYSSSSHLIQDSPQPGTRDIFLHKPFNAIELTQEVRKALDTSSL